MYVIYLLNIYALKKLEIMAPHQIPLEYYKRDQQNLTGLMKQCDCKTNQQGHLGPIPKQSYFPAHIMNES